jgi:MoaA/NifB/PqqE/SkfB family radical SAM enzyme
MEETKKRFIKSIREIKSLSPSVYDITSDCNLSCEGCYYYEGEGNPKGSHQLEPRNWKIFFGQEKERGVNYPHLAGGEPAIRKEVLEHAYSIWRRGAVYTNGTIKVDRHLEFKIIISIWGNQKTDESLRGLRTWEKIFNNYRDDKRACLLFTFNAANINDFDEVYALSKDMNIPLCISLYSPTRNRIKEATVDRLEPSRDDITLIASKLSGLKNTHGKLIAPEEYLRKALDPINTFDVDEHSGWARKCTLLQHPVYRHYSSEQAYDPNACCTPYVDCGRCRVYLNIYTNIISRAAEYKSNEKNMNDWIEVADSYLEMHFVKADT